MIGNTEEPGVTATVDSAPSISANGPSAGTPLVVGSADLEDGSANSNEVYSIDDSIEAQRHFGKQSRLTRNIIDAQNQGAGTVLAIAPAESTVEQDISGLSSTNGSLDNPAKEGVDEITVTVDETEKTVEYRLSDVGEESVDADHAYFNPTNGQFELDTAPSTSGTIEYTQLEYNAAFNAVKSYTGDVDFITALKERSDVTTGLLGTANDLSNEYQLVLAVAGLTAPVDPDAFTNSYDTSRLQLLAPVRTEDYGSLLGAYVGLRAELGLTSTPINQRIALRSRPAQGLGKSERGALIDKFVTPLERIGESVRIADDLTTVSEENDEESNMRYGFSRLVVDYLIETVNDLEQPFVGKFNSPGAIGQLEDLLNEGARSLSQSNAIYSYDATVKMIDPVTVRVTFRADVAEPIRFIQNDFVIGNDLELQNQ